MSQFGKPKPALLLQTRICLVFSKPTGADVDKRNINFELRKVTRLLKIVYMFYVLIMTLEIKRNILNFIIRKVSRIISHHLSVYKSIKLIWKMHTLTNRVVLDIGFSVT